MLLLVGLMPLVFKSLLVEEYTEKNSTVFYWLELDLKTALTGYNLPKKINANAIKESGLYPVGSSWCKGII